MFHYSICTVPDRDLFYKQCSALERHIPGIKAVELLETEDGSLIQIYEKDGMQLTVHNSEYIGALFVDSGFDLKTYFPKARTNP